MENRCDSVDALMYAYYEFMRNKEENQMLEKNKDYIEMRVSSTDCAFVQNAPTQICVDGYVYTSYIDLPDPGELYVFISKEKFNKLQTENEELKKKLEGFAPVPGYREFLTALYPGEDVEKLVWATEQLCCGRDLRHALQTDLEHYRAISSSQGKFIYSLKEKYETLSKLVGFDSEGDIEDYLVNEAECDTLHEAILKLKDQVKYTCDEWKDMKKKLEECEKDYISERDKAEALEKENKELKNKLHEFDPIPEFKELTEKLQSTEDVEELEWVLNHTCESWGSVNGWRSIAQFWKGRYEDLSKLRNEGTHIVYLNDPIGIIARWERVTGYDRPEDFLKWKTNIEGIMEAWRSATGCTYPADARRLLEKWKEATGYSTPEGFESAMLNDPDNVWRDATCCNSPLEVNILINEYKATIQKWKDMTKCETPEAAATWITSYESACERGNRLAKEIENWQKATDCDTPEGAKAKIEHYKSRLGNAVQAASCAAKHLDNITF